jgi:hypothetical protein
MAVEAAAIAAQQAGKCDGNLSFGIRHCLGFSLAGAKANRLKGR